MEARLQGLRHQPPHDVGDAAGLEGDDELHGARRISVLRLRGGRGGKDEVVAG